MNILRELEESFPILNNNQISDDQILDEPHPSMLQTDLSEIEVLPFYMVWCVKNSNNLNTVPDGTIAVIAEYGRRKGDDKQSLFVTSCCNDAQITTIFNFLLWFKLNFDYYDEQQFQRTFVRWQKLANKAFKRN